MALCVQTETVYIPMTNSATPRYQMDIVRRDWAGSDTNCAGWLLLTQTEFQDMKTSGVQITSAAEAEPIASALLCLTWRVRRTIARRVINGGTIRA